MASSASAAQPGRRPVNSPAHDQMLSNPVWRAVDIPGLLTQINKATKKYLTDGEVRGLNRETKHIIIGDLEKVLPKMIKDLVIRISGQLPENEQRELNKLERPDCPQLFYSKFNPRDKIDLTPEREPKTYQVIKTLGNPNHARFVDYIFTNAQAYRLHVDEKNEEHNIPFERFVSYVKAHKTLTEELEKSNNIFRNKCFWVSAVISVYAVLMINKAVLAKNGYKIFFT